MYFLFTAESKPFCRFLTISLLWTWHYIKSIINYGWLAIPVSVALSDEYNDILQRVIENNCQQRGVIVCNNINNFDKSHLHFKIIIEAVILFLMFSKYSDQ